VTEFLFYVSKMRIAYC